MSSNQPPHMSRPLWILVGLSVAVMVFAMVFPNGLLG